MSCELAVPTNASAAYIADDLFTLKPPSGLQEVTASAGPRGAAAGQVAGYARTPSEDAHAIVQGSGSGKAVDLHPTSLGFQTSIATGTNGNEQWGVGTRFDGTSHALLWHDNTVTDLTPAGFPRTNISDSQGGQQVGSGNKTVNDASPHALLWKNGDPGSVVDLHPTLLHRFAASVASGTDGIHQVGSAYIGDLSGPAISHAILWSGTAASAVDLTPASAISAQALAVHGAEQVGTEVITQIHAMLWRGTASSAVDLHPGRADFDSSVAFDTNGSLQVGYEFNATVTHALVWSGTASSAIDLQGSLSSNFTSSAAYSVDDAGNIFGTATDTAGNIHAIQWIAPEPGGAVLLMLPATMLFFRRTRRKSN